MTTIHTSTKDQQQPTIINHAASLSVAGRPLPPPLPETNKDNGGSIVLFYQYKEHPVWTRSEHKHVLKHMTRLGERHGMTGRGRIAPEGVNCTLTCRTPHAVRAFCTALREWNPAVFQTTDFKITDGLAPSQVFGALSLRKTTELVAYGLSSSTTSTTTTTTTAQEDTIAPSITQFGGHHLPADAYHAALAHKDTVVIDVRNRYETQLGQLVPPPGGATVLDPQLRKSNEFPAWLDRVQPQLEDKTVLMYCTGGIRCERASALLNQMRAAAATTTTTSSTSATTTTKKPKAVYELQGGIERYLHTFPHGGYWKGKNYLFDRRFEQVPLLKSPADVEAEMNTTCCVCTQKWTVYRGQYACDTCRVPVIVCSSCATTIQKQQQQQSSATTTSHKKIRLECDLCRQGYRAPTHTVDLVGMKRQADAAVRAKQGNKKQKKEVAEQSDGPCNRLFLSRLPLIVSKTKIADALECRIEVLHWMTDQSTGAFYGSCMVQTDRGFVDCSNVRRRIADNKRSFKVQPIRESCPWPPPAVVDTELPPLGFLSSPSAPPK